MREPYIKRYDDHAESDPRQWPALFTLDRWGFFLARQVDKVLGGAAAAPGSDVSTGGELLATSAVLWDIRVDERSRREGVGAALFRAVERWSIARHFSRLVAETQDTNVGACRFYQSMGCTLTGWELDGYADVPGEARLVWERALVDDQR
jgi:GNAT superfamily N-acetyltransferase